MNILEFKEERHRELDLFVLYYLAHRRQSASPDEEWPILEEEGYWDNQLMAFDAELCEQKPLPVPTPWDFGKQICTLPTAREQYAAWHRAAIWVTASIEASYAHAHWGPLRDELLARCEGWREALAAVEREGTSR